MTNKQLAMIETVKMLAFMCLMVILITALIGMGYSEWLGYTLVTVGTVYLVLMLYEINLNRIEYQQYLQNMVDKK